MEVKAADVGLLQSRYRLTKQRAAVLRALSGGGHLSAEGILHRVREEIPAVSLGTIYRTLEILRAIGLVQAFTHGGDAARYEAALDKHHHLLCSQCRHVLNVHAPELARIVYEVASAENFDQVDYSLTIVGRCARCATAARTVSNN
ncbi:MAG: transcriptional repressor [Candidatus Eremiobacteraeota bacterium]|nr:transcriptional repressor [Candidatus Eremiobacteraeota bacterium]MBV9647071.1 transcriptional repressor [Candidatus Eremiobacteraeota bacterium]